MNQKISKRTHNGERVPIPSEYQYKLLLYRYNSMDDLFDIAHQTALMTINIDENKVFLVKQREKVQ